MELRVLRYFLVVAREENITRASQLLHITQPTLSRQLIQLEDELGVKLFKRSKYRIILTDEGMLLRRRAQELVDLADKTEREFQRHEEELSGEIAIGCGESNSMSFLSVQMAAFRKENPLVSFDIYSATADDIKDRLENGILDIGLLAEPVEIGRYDFIRMPREDVWGVIVRRDSHLASLERVTARDLLGVPLILARRRQVKDEIASWFGEYYEHVEVAGTFNLILNAANMVLNGVGVAMGFDLADISDELRFVPLYPELKTGTVLVWKKNQANSPAAAAFLRRLRNVHEA